MTTHGVAPFPLYWPLQHKRTAAHARREAAFQVDFHRARTDLLRQLHLLGAASVLLSSNVPVRRDGLMAVPDREPDDPGIAVYFTRSARPYVVACDQFRRIRWNVRAIGATLEALRAIERHGTTSMMEQAFSGFAQLPAAGARRPWREVLGVPPGPCDVDALRQCLRDLSRVHHPDAGGDPGLMIEITGAYEEGLREIGGSP